MADIQKIVDAVLSVEDDNNKFGVLDGIIDADWHPDHLKPDSEEAYDKAISTGAAEIQGLTQQEKYDLLTDVIVKLSDVYFLDPESAMYERFQNWGIQLNKESFKPNPDTSDREDFGPDDLPEA